MQDSAVTPVKWFAAVLYREQNLLEDGLARLVEELSEIDLRGPAVAFTQSDYYRPEMGSNLRRVLVSFNQLGSPARLPEIKHFCAGLEQKLSQNGQRRINIDPGYIDLFKVVLASFKARGNKLYLGDAVWADPTLYYQKKAWHAFAWSFPDFKSGVYHQTLLQMRALYKDSLRHQR